MGWVGCVQRGCRPRERGHPPHIRKE
jgi:hypothetical protein